MTSFKIIETGNYKIELLEAHPCNSKDELTAREGYHIRANPTCVNKNIAGRTVKEWKNEYQVNIKKYNKEYQEYNKEKLKDYRKIYWEKNKDKLKEKYECECGGKYTYNSKAQHFKTKLHQTWIQSALK